jgi:hypothetical protein
MAGAYAVGVLLAFEAAPHPVWAVWCAILPADPNNGLYGDRSMIFGGEGSFSSAAEVYEEDPSRRLVEQAAQCHLLRDIFGNPFRPRPARPFPAEVHGLAEVCYAAFPEQSPELALLADALQDLGEEGAATHLREGSHVKGCHVLDWVLGRG